MGQWFTPPELVDLTLVLAAPTGTLARTRLIDPTCGDGAFLAGARRRGAREEALVGVEVDGDTAAKARSRLPLATVVQTDLFAFEPAERFDLVVGNPPYVRLDRTSRGQRLRARASLTRALGPGHEAQIAALCARGDLSGPCLLRSLLLLRPGGRLAMVVSSALLDADYAGLLWRMVDELGEVEAVVHSADERWFREAAVNAMIVVIERRDAAPAAAAQRSGGVELATLRLPLQAAAARAGQGLTEVAEVRSGDPAAPKQWAERLRADDHWLRLRQRLGSALVSLEQRATVWRGATTGANEFFYCRGAERSALEPATLAPLLRAPRARGACALAHSSAELEWAAVVGPPGGTSLRSCPAFRARVTRFAALAARPSLRGRKPWWSLGQRPARLFLPKAYASRFVALITDRPVLGDQRLYAVDPAVGRFELLAATLNSVFTALAIESTGRASMGLGALELSVADAHALSILDPDLIAPAAATEVIAAFRRRAARPVDKLEVERHCGLRRAMDEAIAAAHGLGPREVDLAWHALVRANRRRIERASRLAVD